MTKAELKAALAIALDHKRSLLDVDTTPLHGLYLPTFKGPVTTTLPVVARVVRELAVKFNGEADAEALAEFGPAARYKILIVG